MALKVINSPQSFALNSVFNETTREHAVSGSAASHAVTTVDVAASTTSPAFTVLGTYAFIEFSGFGSAASATLQFLSGDGSTWVSTTVSATITAGAGYLTDTDLAPLSGLHGIEGGYRFLLDTSDTGTIYVYGRG